ncbi:conserved hypothetical protein [Neospora caninum Liverpool]|uniref:Uncharacterized protein n=1 Tax=Neospora caninum (strain Liverpool) TaxID=572307 RepID=F0VJJ2_NEOCL|nr:conserved hypothetical protein [Neospora caninum Liverpool]CBZ53903.1 conserved hypothetical protein [Neospora caninum Liverpool]|eukprot:XP_003883935.1 conserved hypothetical protein [Neospora caninum Liverpool]
MHRVAEEIVQVVSPRPAGGSASLAPVSGEEGSATLAESPSRRPPVPENPQILFCPPSLVQPSRSFGLQAAERAGAVGREDAAATLAFPQGLVRPSARPTEAERAVRSAFFSPYPLSKRSESETQFVRQSALCGAREETADREERTEAGGYLEVTTRALPRCVSMGSEAKGRRREELYAGGESARAAGKDFASLRHALLQQSEDLRMQLGALDRAEKEAEAQRKASEKREQTLLLAYQGLKRKYKALVRDFAFNRRLLQSRDEELDRVERYAFSLLSEMEERKKGIEEAEQRRAAEEREKQRQAVREKKRQAVREKKKQEARERERQRHARLRLRTWGVCLQVREKAKEEREEMAREMEARLVRLQDAHDEEVHRQREEAEWQRELLLKEAEKNARRNLDNLLSKVTESEDARQKLTQTLKDREDQLRAAEERAEASDVALALLEEEVAHLRRECEHERGVRKNLALEKDRELERLAAEHAQEIQILKQQMAEQHEEHLAAFAEARERHARELQAQSGAADEASKRQAQDAKRDRNEADERRPVGDTQTSQRWPATDENETREAILKASEHERASTLSQRDHVPQQTRWDLERQLEDVRKKLEQREAELALAVESRVLAAEALQQFRLFHGDTGQRSESFVERGARASDPASRASPLQSLPSHESRSVGSPTAKDSQHAGGPRNPQAASTGGRAAECLRAGAVDGTGAERSAASLNAEGGEEQQGKAALFPGDLGSIHVSPLQLSPVAETTRLAPFAQGAPLCLPSPRFGKGEIAEESEQAPTLRQMVCAAWQALARKKPRDAGERSRSCLPRIAQFGDEATPRRRETGDSWRVPERETDVTDEDVVWILQTLLGEVAELEAALQPLQRQLLAATAATVTLQKERDKLMEITNRQCSRLHRLRESPPSSFLARCGCSVDGADQRDAASEKPCVESLESRGAGCGEGCDVDERREHEMAGSREEIRQRSPCTPPSSAIASAKSNGGVYREKNANASVLRYPSLVEGASGAHEGNQNTRVLEFPPEEETGVDLKRECGQRQKRAVVCARGPITNAPLMWIVQRQHMSENKNSDGKQCD